jgi:hypothetical protein
MILKKRFIIMLSAFSALVLAFAALLYFLFTDIKGSNDRISSLASTLSFETGKQEYLLSTGRTIQNANSEISTIGNSIVPSDGEVAFIENIEALARADGLTVSIDSLAIDGSDLLHSAGMEQLSVKLKTHGSFAGTHRFLAETESLPFKVAIDQASLSLWSDPAAADAKDQKPRVAWDGSIAIRVLKYK